MCDPEDALGMPLTVTRPTRSPMLISVIDLEVEIGEAAPQLVYLLSSPSRVGGRQRPPVLDRVVGKEVIQTVESS